MTPASLGARPHPAHPTGSTTSSNPRSTQKRGEALFFAKMTRAHPRPVSSGIVPLTANTPESVCAAKFPEGNLLIAILIHTLWFCPEKQWLPLHKHSPLQAWADPSSPPATTQHLRGTRCTPGHFADPKGLNPHAVHGAGAFVCTSPGAETENAANKGSTGPQSNSQSAANQQVCRRGPMLPSPSQPQHHGGKQSKAKGSSS